MKKQFILNIEDPNYPKVIDPVIAALSDQVSKINEIFKKHPHSVAGVPLFQNNLMQSAKLAVMKMPEEEGAKIAYGVSRDYFWLSVGKGTGKWKRVIYIPFNNL